MELLSKLGIDWRLFLAQIVNFLILLFILYKFLYKPVLGLLQRRTAQIEKSLADAKKIEENLKKAEEERLVQLVEARREAQQIIEEAKKEGEKIRNQAKELAQEEAQKIIENGRIQIERQKESLLREIKQEIGNLVVYSTRQILEEIGDEKIDQTIIESTMRKIMASSLDKHSN
jgi:F-type H+-transporting ATPase subunit b